MFVKYDVSDKKHCLADVRISEFWVLFFMGGRIGLERSKFTKGDLGHPSTSPW